jgi:putative transposase
MIFDDRAMYRWRKMSPEQREQAGQDREELRLPFHSPPHCESDCGLYLVTAACFEHAPIIGASPGRMQAFERDLLGALQELCPTIFAWTVLPNHYHVLVENHAVKKLLRRLGQLHGRTSFEWNGEDGRRGRKVWFNAAETAMKSDGHFWATMNYVLHNAVRHGYVECWTDWPHCSARVYLETVGREEATRIWRQYPLLDFGNDWDPPDL